MAKKSDHSFIGRPHGKVLKQMMERIEKPFSILAYKILKTKCLLTDIKSVPALAFNSSHR